MEKTPASYGDSWQANTASDEVKAATGLADRDLNAAIGWLAREGKVEIEESKVGRKTIIYLTLCYYIS